VKIEKHPDDLSAMTPPIVGCDDCGLCTFRLGYYHCGTRYRPTGDGHCTNYTPIRDDLPRPKSPEPPEAPVPSKTMDRIDTCNMHLRNVDEQLERIDLDMATRETDATYMALEGLRAAVNALMIEVREIRGAKR
jgi:hypothetical protein